MYVQKMHSIELAKTGSIANLSLKPEETDPDLVELIPGSLWYNKNEKCFKYSVDHDIDGTMEVHKILSEENMDEILTNAGSSSPSVLDFIKTFEETIIYTPTNINERIYVVDRGTFAYFEKIRDKFNKDKD